MYIFWHISTTVLVRSVKSQKINLQKKSLNTYCSAFSNRFSNWINTIRWKILEHFTHLNSSYMQESEIPPSKSIKKIIKGVFQRFYRIFPKDVNRIVNFRPFGNKIAAILGRNVEFKMMYVF